MARRLGSARTVNADSMERIYRARYILVKANAIVGTVVNKTSVTALHNQTVNNSTKG